MDLQPIFWVPPVLAAILGGSSQLFGAAVFLVGVSGTFVGLRLVGPPRGRWRTEVDLVAQVLVLPPRTT